MKDKKRQKLIRKNNKKLRKAKKINKFLIVGHEDSGYEVLVDLLGKSGIEQADALKKEKILPHEISRVLLSNHKVGKKQQVEVSPVWNGLALDLMMSNMDKKSWCWADPDALKLLDFWKSMDDNLGFILVYDDPKTFAKKLLKKEEAFTPETIKAKLKAWKNYHEILLRFFYKNREKVLLLHASHIYANTKEYVEKLSTKVGTPLISESTVMVEESSNEHDRYLEYLVTELVQRTKGVEKVYTELQSVATLPFGDHYNNKPIDIYEAFSAYQKSYRQTQQLLQEEQQKLLALKADAEEESSQLLTQLHHVQEELEKYFLENSEYQKRIGSFTEENSKNTQIVKELEEKKRALLQKLEKTENDKASLTKELENLKAAVEKSKKGEKESQAENALLLTQLHHVQEELEKYYLENQNLKEKIAEKERYYGAADRIRNQLSYRLGQMMIEKSKNPIALLFMPLHMFRVYRTYKKDMKNRKEKLPPIHTYADAYEAERVKQHLSYRLGQTTLQTMKNPFGLLILPFRLVGTYRTFKKNRSE